MSPESAPAERTIRFSLICEAPPASPETDFGIQDKAGGLMAGEPQADGSLRFDGEIRTAVLGDGRVRLRGLLVHGPPDRRFLYLSCRASAGSSSRWLFRLKVPLDGIDGTVATVRARISGGKTGTVALLGAGWSNADGG